MHSLTIFRRRAPLLALALGLILTGCGASAIARTTAPSISPTATSMPTTTTAPTSVLPPDCANAAVFAGAKRLGGTDLAINGPELSNMAYPGRLLPDGTPLKPLKVDPHPWTFVGFSRVNPTWDGPGGYNFALCNGSPTLEHTISAVSFRIETVTPYTGQLNQWPFCWTFAYHPGSKSADGVGCGGANANDEWLKVSFKGDATSGATVAAEQVQTSNGNIFYPEQPPYGPIPVKLPAGKAIAFNMNLALPSAPATYTFSVGISIDGAPPVFSASTDPVVQAPTAHYWDGAACLTPAMQAQIPPNADPQSAYICPES